MLELCYRKDVIEAGCDEAGRGCLAGPVFAAAVILPSDFYNDILNDSKQISEKKRDILREIIEREAEYAVAQVNPLEIDQINILNASILGMHRSLDQLNATFQHIAVDGNKFKPYKEIEYTTLIKGDGRFMNIAAASVLAKTHRDEYMRAQHTKFPHYSWDKNKGYPTAQHRDAIRKFGTCEEHRLSFQLLPQQLPLL